MVNGKSEGGKMIELKRDDLVFTFPKIHKDAELRITFQRTLRIPDDDTIYPLPPGLGNFPLRHVDDFAETVPKQWMQHGGVMMPMYQSEALWINFSSKYISNHRAEYPFAVKVATGKVNAVTGDEWQNHLSHAPQDYIVASEQPWLDGYCVGKGLIRQFVAMPLGSGYSAEEQLTDKAEHGGLQIIVYPMKKAVFENLFPERDAELKAEVIFSRSMSVCEAAAPDMGLAPGGKMNQEIYEDPYDFDDWEKSISSRCFVHLANSLVWRSIAGEEPPTVPFTSKEYTQAKLPWFDFYNEKAASVEGADKLNSMKSIVRLGKEKGDNPLPDNESISIKTVISLHKKLAKDQVREGTF